MTIHIVEGDLLQSDCNVIVHQANCFATMGAGIAKQIKEKHPKVFAADHGYPIPVGDKRRLGKFSHCWVDAPHGRQLVVNLYGQYHYGQGKQTDERAFENALDLFFTSMKYSMDSSQLKIGMPYGIGCGLAGGDWQTIFGIISKLSDQYNIDIYLYKFKQRRC